MNTVFCKNRLCGKEYHESFEKCPFCGTPNESYIRHPELEKKPKKYSIWTILLAGLIILGIIFLNGLIKSLF